MGTTQYPGATPFWLQVAVVVIQIVWGILLLKKVMQARGGIRVAARCPTGQRLLLLSPDSRHTQEDTQQEAVADCLATASCSPLVR